MPGFQRLRWLGFLLCGALSVSGCAAELGSPQSETGSLSVDLVIADGIAIDQVGWQITGNGMDMSDTINVSAPGSTASVEVFGLPPGEDDYKVTLTAESVDERIICRGSADFNVEIGQTTNVMVILNCKPPRRFGSVRVDGKFNICSELTKAVVSPLQTAVGYGIDLSAQAVDQEGDSIAFFWAGTGGSFADASAAATTYTCEEVGAQEITISVTDNDEYCDMATWTVPVTCVAGDGGTGGTGGETGGGGAGGETGGGGAGGETGGGGAGGETGGGGAGGAGGAAPGQALYIDLTWTTPGDPDPNDTGPTAGSDLDLHFAHPLADSGADIDGDPGNDPWFDVFFDVFWFNLNPNWGAVDPGVDDNPIVLRDDTDGTGPEIIALEIGEQVTYRIGVHYWNDHGFGPSDAVVRIYLDGELAYTSSPVTLTHRDMWDVAEVVWPTQTVNPVIAAGGGPKITANYNHPSFTLP